jgi:catechol 2,3-dioxygenase
MSEPRRSSESTAYIVPEGTRIGHVHLKVADLERAVAFYRDVLGFDVKTYYPGAAFLAAGEYHHHIGLNVWESRGGPPPARGTTGLYHVAILYPTRRDLARALRQLIAHGIPLDGAPTTGSARPSTSATRTATAWSSTSTARPTSGPANPTATSG